MMRCKSKLITPGSVMAFATEPLSLHVRRWVGLGSGMSKLTEGDEFQG